MNSITKVIVVMSSLLLAGSISAKTVEAEQAYINSYQGRTDVPVPVEVISPVASPDFVGQQVDVEFVVDKMGKPTAITVKSPADLSAERTVKSAVARWKFSPAVRDGQAVSMKVVLPVRFVESID